MPRDRSERASVDVLEHVRALMEEADKRYQQRFDAQTKAIDAALQAAKEAVTKAETANDKRFESLNEMRGSLNDMVSTLMTRTESLSMHAATAEKIDHLSSRVDKSEGAGGGLKQGWVYLSGAVALGLSILSAVVLMR